RAGEQRARAELVDDERFQDSARDGRENRGGAVAAGDNADDLRHLAQLLELHADHAVAPAGGALFAFGVDEAPADLAHSARAFELADHRAVERAALDEDGIDQRAEADDRDVGAVEVLVHAPDLI